MKIDLTPQEIDFILQAIENSYGQIIAYDKKALGTKVYLKLKKILEDNKKMYENVNS